MLVPAGLIAGLIIKDKKINQLTWFATLMLITYFLVISTAKTKLEWYDIPMYPFLALIIANFVYYVFTSLQQNKWLNNRLRVNPAPFIFLIVIGIKPYQKIFKKTYFPKEYSWDEKFYQIGYYLKDAIKGKHNINNQFLVSDDYNAHNLFYINVLQDKGVNISIKNRDDLNPFDIVIVPQKHNKQYIMERFNYEIVHSENTVVTYKINGRKD